MALLRQCHILLGTLLCTLLTSPPLAGASLELNEQKIKAGLLYNFLKYTQWPESSFTSSAVTVCIFGDDPFEGNLDAMRDRTVNRREISIRQSRDMEDMRNCHMIFVNAREKSRWPRLRQFLSGKSILTVSDYPAFASSGGMIEFGRHGSRVGASLNAQAVAAAGLRVEERLLRLVTVLTPARQEKSP